MSKPTGTIRAFVFDAYGTLFDVHSAVARHRGRLGKKADAVSAMWRTKQLEYTWLRSLMRCHADFEQVVHEALDYTFLAHGVTDKALHADLRQAYFTLAGYSDAPDTLAALQQRGMKTAILSNGCPAMLKAGAESAGVSEYLDAVLSVEAIGVYKPDPRVYQIAVDHLRIAAEAICFVSSNAWDAAGAAQFGFRVMWINRFQQPAEILPGSIAGQLTSLTDLLHNAPAKS